MHGTFLFLAEKKKCGVQNVPAHAVGEKNPAHAVGEKNPAHAVGEKTPAPEGAKKRAPAHAVSKKTPRPRSGQEKRFVSFEKVTQKHLSL